MPNRNAHFTTIRTEGALLPADLLQRISEGTNLDGLTPESYHLYPGEKLNEAVNQRWNRLQGVWTSFKAAQERLPENDLGTTLTRERWLMPLFRELDYGRLQTAPAAEIDGRSYPISHRWEHVPLHLVSYKLDLDKRTPGATGAASASPHSLLQVFLNRSDDNLWGFLSNGYKLRILRDNASLTRQAYVEFDLEAMMEGEVYSDFVLLWLLCHQSRVEGDKPSDCWLEKWMKVAEDQGTRALDQLREGVEAAITALGLGFLEHPANATLRDRLQSTDANQLSQQDYYRQLLRMVYRLLFLFVAEDRNLLLNPSADEAARQRYTLYYSTQRLRRMAESFKGTNHPDLFESLRLIMRLLSGENSPRPDANAEGLGVRVDMEAGSGLGLIPLGSFLFSDNAVSDVIACQIANRHLLDAIRALSLTYDTRAQVYRSVDYRNLGPEELGSIYESLLELHPQINVPARRFALATAGGNERKTTGSYYTPTSLINALLDSALNPVLNEAAKKGEESILALKICDPACGSGHFLIAAAHRMAKALAFVRTGEEEPPPAAVQEAKRDIISHCIYGVDINPMAVELCKVNLWMEALEPGKPLNFLDHRIQVGNSLLGTTPALMAKGIPDDAFNPIEGDDPKTAAAYKKQNKKERDQRKANVRQLDLFSAAPPANYRALTDATRWLDRAPDETLDQIRIKEQMYHQLANDPEYIKARLLADAWCAAFVWRKGAAELPQSERSGDPEVKSAPRQESQTDDSSPLSGTGRGFRGGVNTPFRGEGIPPMTDLLYRRMEADPLADDLQSIRAYVVALKERYQFFHWHIAFPDVFTIPDSIPPRPEGEGAGGEGHLTGWHGGFDCVLGNPPWERIKIQEKEWFAERAPEIASAPNAAARRRAINELAERDPHLLQAFADDKRKAEGDSHFVRVSDRYPLCGRGDVNTYTIFAETSRHIINGYGRVGVIVPSGIATDDTTKFFFQDLMRSGSLASMYSFENEEFVFPTIHHATKFSLLTMVGSSLIVTETDFLFFARQVSYLKDNWRHFTLSIKDMNLISPNTGSTATFRSQKDAEITKNIYGLVPVLIRDIEPQHNHWKLNFLAMLHMANDSSLFRTSEELLARSFMLQGNIFSTDGKDCLPLYEAKMIHQFDHRFGTYLGQTEAQANQGKLPELDYGQHADPNVLSMPRYWVDEWEVENRLNSKWNHSWLIGWRDITSSVTSRTLISSIVPLAGCGDTLLLMLPNLENPIYCTGLLACLNSYSTDYVTRQKIGGNHLKYHVFKQLPVIPPHTYTPALLDFIVPRVLELTYTAWDLQPFAQDVGYDGPPFIWNEERRFLMRCELDALYFHLYQIPRDDVDYIMETFPIVKRKDEAAHGEYLTKRIILEMYDQMSALPFMSVPAPKDESATYPVPDVSQWATWLTPPPASPEVAHGES